MSNTILGLDTESELPESLIPYAAIAVVKAIDPSGGVAFAVVMTDEMSPMEGSGMLNFGRIYIEELMRKTFKIDKGKSPKAK